MTSLKAIINNKYLKTFVFRYLIYFVVVIEALLLPRLLDISIYAEIEYFKNLLFLSPFLLLGVHSGITYRTLKKKVNSFVKIFYTCVIFSMITVVIMSLIFSNYSFSVAMFFFMIGIVVETNLKIKNKFNIALSYKPLISAFLLIFVLISLKIEFFSHTSVLINLSFLSAFIFWIIISKEKLFKFPKLDFVEFQSCVKIGFPMTIATAQIAVMFFLDRYFLEKFFLEILPSYSFSFSLSQMVILGLTSINYVSQITLGEKIKSINKKNLVTKLKISLIIFSILFLLAFLFINFFLIYFYPNFTDITFMFVLITIPKGIFFIVGAITPVLFYKDKLIKNILVVSIFLLLNFLINNYLVFQSGVEYYKLLIASGVIITLLSFFNIFQIFRIRFN